MKLQKIMWHPRCNARAYEASGSRTTYEAKWNSQRVPDKNAVADPEGQDTPVCNVKQWIIVNNQDMVDNQNIINNPTKEMNDDDQDEYEGTD